MARKVKCLYCGEQFEKEKEEFAQVGKRYAHKKCYEEYLLKKNEDDEYKVKLEDFIKKLYGQVLPLHRKQVKTLIDNGMTHSTIYKTLYYFYEVKGNTTEKSKGIGIVPYIVGEAREYYIKMNSLQVDAQTVQTRQKETNNIVVKIKSPQAKRKTAKKFDFDFLEGVIEDGNK